MNSELRSYFAALLVAVLYKMGFVICVFRKANIIELIEKKFKKFLVNEGDKLYDSYRNLA